MALSGVEREDWMRRIGPLYPVMVAFQLQSRLPLLTHFEPTEEDLERAEPYLALIGLGVGAGLSVAARMLLSLGVPAGASAALIVFLGTILTGAWFEVGLGRAAEFTGRLWDPAGHPSAGRVALPSAICMALVGKYAVLAATPVARWWVVLLCAHVFSRWTVLLSWKLGTLHERPAEDSAPWVGFAVTSAISGLIVLACGRSPALLSGLFAVALGFVAVHLGRHYPRAREDYALAAGALVELATLFCFAAA